MFVMTNDGGLPEKNARHKEGSVYDMDIARIFVQRTFLLEILSTGASIVLLEGAEYRDSKVIPWPLSIIHICHADLYPIA
jgi:hypothetical protein